MLLRTGLLCWTIILPVLGAARTYQEVLSVDHLGPQNPSSATSQFELLATHTACDGLQAHFPHLVSFPSDDLYQRQQSRYWSMTQGDLAPACRLTPTNTLETSQVIQYLNHHHLDISITSGGHSTVLGASNLQAGITLDLSSLSSISIAADNASISFGSGARWLDVYKKLGPSGMTVAGARAGSVGAGGFLLGGGISILAPSHGWSCDTLISIEVVLGNGTVVTADSSHHKDLFTSMKGSGANFGIATRFNMSLFPMPQLQLGIFQIHGNHFDSLAREFSTFIETSHHDPDVSLDLSIVPDSTRRSLVSYLMLTRLGSINESQVLRPFFVIPHSHESVRDVRPEDLAHTVDMSNPYGFRHTRYTMTIRNDLSTILAILSIVQVEFLRNDIAGDDFYRPAMLLQPIYRAQLGAGNTTRNALGLDEDTEPLILLSLEATWSHESLDTNINTRLAEILTSCQDTAKSHNALHPFIYSNYAGEGQDVLELSRERGYLERLRGVQMEYDKDEYVRDHIQIPFKVGAGEV